MANLEELSEKSKKAHQEDVKQYDKGQNALCFIVIGGILLVISLLFFILSFAKKANKVAGVNVNSLQFYVCVICGIISIGCLVYGIVKFVKSHLARKKLAQEINEINKMKKENI